MGSPHNKPLGVEWFSLVMGLGFVLSFGYWFSEPRPADSMNAARGTPLIAAVPKMLFPFLVIFPGLIALAITQPVSNQLAATGGSAPRSAQCRSRFLEDCKVTEFDFMPIMLRRLTLTGSTLRPRSVEEKAAIAGDLRAHVWPRLESCEMKVVIHLYFHWSTLPPPTG